MQLHLQTHTINWKQGPDALSANVYLTMQMEHWFCFIYPFKCEIITSNYRQTIKDRDKKVKYFILSI